MGTPIAAYSVRTARFRRVRRPSALSAFRSAQTLLSHHLELTVFDDNHPDLNFYFGTVCGPPRCFAPLLACWPLLFATIDTRNRRLPGEAQPRGCVGAALGPGPMLLA